MVLFVVPLSVNILNANYRLSHIGIALHRDFGYTLTSTLEKIMRIPLDRQSATPLYQQIQKYLRVQIQAGQLMPDTRLPATRKLAQDLGVSRITVQNAYADLESEGLIGSREGSGCRRHAARSPTGAARRRGGRRGP